MPLLVIFQTVAQAQVECSNPNPDGSYEVPEDWELIPAGIKPDSRFRLLFVTSGYLRPDSTDIAVYNTFVQNHAKAGHAAISDSCGNLFKVVGSTATVNARVNTDTEASDADAAIYWLKGVKVADDYADFYDGSWDNTDSSGKPYKNENGITDRSAHFRVAIVPTGTNNDGTTSSRPLGSTPFVTGTELHKIPPFEDGAAPSNITRTHYGLSPVFTTEGHATAEVSLIWTESIPAPPLPREPKHSSGRERAKEVHEGDSGTTDVPFYVRTERLHSSKLPFRVCVSGNATQDTTGNPQPEVEDDYQLVVDNAVQGRCVDTSIPANERYKRMTIRVLNEDRPDNLRGDMEQVVLTLSQAPGNPLPAPYRIVSHETGYHKLQLNIVDDDFLQQPVQFSPAEYETDTAVPRAQTRRVKEAHRGGRVGLMFTKGAEYTPYTVTYRVVHAESTATYGADYTLAGYNRNTDRGTIRVPRQGGAALQVNVVDDKVQELEEKFVIEMVSVSSPLWVNKKDNRHKLSIAIDDNSPRSELNFDWLERTVQEGHGADTHDVRVSLRPEARGFGFRPQLPEDTHFEYCVESTATPGSDYEITNRAGDFVDRTGGTECWLATIPAGQTKLRLMTLRVLADSDVHEWHERVTVRLKPSTVAAKPTSGFMGIAPNRFADQIQKHPYTFSTLTIKDDIPFVQVSLSGFDDGALLYAVRGTSGPPRGYPSINWVVEDSSGTIESGSFEFRKAQTPSRTVRFRPPQYGSRNDYMIFRLTDGEYRLRNPSHGTVCVPVNSGTCPQLQGSSDDEVAPPQPTAAVANVQVAAVDDANARVTWDAVEHATSYRVEYESTGTLAYQGNYVQGASNGHTGTSWTFTHNAAEAMTLTVTVTPEYVDGNGDTQRLAALAGTATIDVAPAGSTQDTDTQDTVGTAVCETASLKSDIAGYIGEQADGSPHVTRWKKVLAAFGDANGYAAMTAAEAQTYADRGWARWDPVVTALQCIEDAAAAEDTSVEADPEITVSGGSAIAEGGNAVFTVEANPAPAGNLAVTLTVDDDATGDFLSAGNEGTQTVTVQAGQSSATLTLATENDTTDEPDGSVSATMRTAMATRSAARARRRWR